MTTHVEVRRDASTDTRIVAEPPAPLGQGEVRLKTGRFALAATNVACAVAGDLAGR
ncbi:MAG: hypothetical protein NZM40_08000 [Sphingomonadaceae bacterium]|uniref:hypothetical protein n=1 Tax=Thermaurantiacus sp. TaxID=2820283 RepID=UPI00298F0724|nr:hypothetical protein [Thermaurantiacus sp.]MCS6987353.1 hypothetical protein [Sphingomonadaceae bacterium]MDW8414574.1 hypothetical protein [Thermaurantiacus sp.]